MITAEGDAHLTDRLRDTADGLVDLVRAQIKLVRLELLDDARAVSTRLLRLLGFGLALVCGWGFLNAAGAVALSRHLGLTGALLVVGAGNIVLGLGGCLQGMRAFRRIRLLDRSRGELARNPSP